MELLVVAIVIALYMAWNVGANDVANSMADAVGSGAVTIFWAMILAGIFEFCGAVFVGAHVTNTVRKGIIESQVFAQEPVVLAHGMVCAMLAAAVWLNMASFFGMPVSTTHSIVGAVVGFGILEAGAAHVHWFKLAQIVGSWFISPVAGGLLAFLIFKVISRFILSVEQPESAARKGIPVCVFFTVGVVVLATIYKGLKNIHLDLSGGAAIGLAAAAGGAGAVISWVLMRYRHRLDKYKSIKNQLMSVERSFMFLVIMTSCTLAFAHGANDVANAVGPLAAVAEIVRYNRVPETVTVQMWGLLLGGGGIVLGLVMFGHRVMRVVATKMTDITPSRGVAADIATMTTVLTCSKLGLPVSTTHTLVGAILGVGLARGITAINRKVVGQIFTSWFVTVPIAAGLAVGFYIVGKWLFW